MIVRNTQCIQIIEPPPPVLPTDVMVEIFSRLPVKTLLRFKCLSKQFLSLINSPDFINWHLQFSSLSPKLILLKQRAGLHFHLFNVNTLDKAYDVDIPVDLGSDSLSFEEIGSCDGLLAAVNRYTGSVIVCNVATRKHKILPFCLNDYIGYVDYVNYRCGFGRGASFDDYKLVMVAASRQKQHGSLRVYSLKTNSWKKIVDFHCYLIFYRMVVNVKGTLNWLCEEINLKMEF